MDISNINKVANAKKMINDSEKLREKVSHEKAKVIKLKVAQDTAYWDLKEKYHQLEKNHERLQQNMVDLQMQYEAVSGKYQDELRLRPETLNKLSSVREITNVLEEYCEGLKVTVSRCKADRAQLGDAYHQLGTAVKEARDKQLQEEQQKQALLAGLQAQVKLQSEHQKQQVVLFGAFKQQAEREVTELRAQLGAERTRADERAAAAAELAERLRRCTAEAELKDENIARLQNDMNSMTRDFNDRIAEMKSAIEKNEQELKETTEVSESLKKALTNQEEFTTSVSQQNSELQEKISSMEEEQITLKNMIKDLEASLVDAAAMSDHLTRSSATLVERKEELENAIAEKDQHITCIEKKIESLKNSLNLVETEKEELTNKLNRASEENKSKAARIEELVTINQTLEKKIRDTESAYEKYKEQAEGRMQQLENTLANRDKELDTKTVTVNKLIAAVQERTEARDRAENALQKAKRELEAEAEMRTEKERRLALKEKEVEQLQLAERNKEDELTQQMSIILNMINEKEQLHHKLQAMQNKIDNVQKELTGRDVGGHDAGGRGVRDPPELDDNAVMGDQAEGPPPAKVRRAEAEAEGEPWQDSLLDGAVSESSLGGFTLDPRQVNRRFSALSRGEPVSPTPLVEVRPAAAAQRPRLLAPAARRPLYNRNKPDADSATQRNSSATQENNELKSKTKMFFKSKRNMTNKGNK